MVIEIVGVAVVLFAIAVVVFAVSRNSRTGARSAARLAKRVGLELPAGLEPTIRMARRSRGTGVIVGVGIFVVITAVVLIVLGPQNPVAIVWYLLAAYFTGISEGSVVGTLVAERRRIVGTVRVARSAAVSVRDYVKPSQILFVRIIVAIAVIAFLIDLWLAATISSGLFSPACGVMAAFALLTLVVFEVASRRIVATGQPAGSSLELAWDDALRSTALGTLIAAPGLLALYSFVALDTIILTAGHLVANPWISIPTGILPMGATIAIVIWVTYVMRASTQRYYLSRLWPDLAAKNGEKAPEAYNVSIMSAR